MTRAVSALLAESANYREVIELRPCDAVPSLVEIRVVSWYLDAKRPNEPQTRFQAFAEAKALLDVKHACEVVLNGLSNAKHGRVA